jgi:hypothetical protein
MHFPGFVAGAHGRLRGIADKGQISARTGSVANEPEPLAVARRFRNAPAPLARAKALAPARARDSENAIYGVSRRERFGLFRLDVGRADELSSVWASTYGAQSLVGTRKRSVASF